MCAIRVNVLIYYLKRNKKKYKLTLHTTALIGVAYLQCLSLKGPLEYRATTKRNIKNKKIRTQHVNADKKNPPDTNYND